MKPNNPITWITILWFIILTFFMLDIISSPPVTEEVIVVHKTFTPTEDGVQPVLVTIQSQPQRAYFWPTTRDLFYGVDEKDRLLVGKKYGTITGWEYRAELLTK